MMLKLTFSICFYFTFASFADFGKAMPQWSAWSECLDGEENCTRRVLICDENTTGKYQCHMANTTNEEIRINCTTTCNESQWILQENSKCEKQNQKSRLEISFCSSDPRCIRKQRISCQNVPPCNGEWKTEPQYCHASCNESGSETVFLQKFFYFPTNKSCIRLSNTVRTRTEMRNCTNDMCNQWSAWVASSRCSASCGGGFMELSRSCVNNTGCTVAVGRQQTRMVRPCNDHKCSTWSSWSTNQTCLNGVQVRSRVCWNGVSPANNCNDEKDFVQATTITCSGSGQSKDFLQSCDRTFYFITIPLIAGFALIFMALLVSIYFGCRRFRRKDFKIVKASDFSENTLENNNISKERYYVGNPDSEIRVSSGNSSTLSSHAGEKKDDPMMSSSSLKNMNETVPLSVSMRGRTGNSVRSNGRKTQSMKETSFHRVSSSPDILKETNKCVQSDHVFKPRPSVRRAERLRIREEQRLKKRRKNKDSDEATMNETQTLCLSDLKNKQSNIEENHVDTERKRSHSVDLSLEIELKSLPVKPSRRHRSNQAEYENVTLGRDRSFTVGGSNPIAESGTPKRSEKPAIYENFVPRRRKTPSCENDNVAEKKAMDDNQDPKRRSRRSATTNVPTKPKRAARSRKESIEVTNFNRLSKSSEQLSLKNPNARFHSLHSLSEAEKESMEYL